MPPFTFLHLNEHRTIPLRDETERRIYTYSQDRFATACGLALQGLGLVPFNVDMLPQQKQGLFARLKNAFSRKRIVAAWGMDIGNSCMKAVKVSLAADGVPVVEHCYQCHYHFEPLKQQQATDLPETKIMETLAKPVNPFARDEPDFETKELDVPEKRKLAVKGFLHKYEYQGEVICVGYPSRDLICANVAIPADTPQVAEAAIPFEFKHHLPYDEDKFLPNYIFLGSTAGDENVMKQCFHLFSTKMSTMQDTLDLLAEYGIMPNMMTTNHLANLNYATFLLMSPPVAQTPEEQVAMEGNEFEPPDIESILICDMGASGMDLIFYDLKELSHFYIPIGGDRFTQEIATALNIPLPRAEGYKRDPLASGHGQEIVDALKPLVKKLANEITLRLERFRKNGGKLDKVIVLGGGFQLRGFAAYFRSVLEALWKQKT